MKRSLRPIASILLLAATLLVVAAPATAAPREEPFSGSTAPEVQLLTALWTWAGSWLGELPLGSLWAPGGAAVDPDGEPVTVGGPDPAPRDTVRAGEGSTNIGT